MIFDAESRLESDPMSAERRVWDDSPLPAGLG